VIQVNPKEWTIDRTKAIFGIGRNDLHFLDVDEEGNLELKLYGKTLSFKDLTSIIRSENGSKKAYTSSFTLRMPQLIHYQVEKLKKAFADASADLKYTGAFSAVYPVKVNQRKDCVIPVLQADKNYGIEAGTKAELSLIRNVLKDEKHRLIICNGAKDPEYLKAIEECVKEGYNIAISVESLYEAKLIVEILKSEDTNLVLRIKPYLTVRGHWSHSAGRDSKFGLSIHDLLDVVSLLKEHKFEDRVTTILGHVGSQITAIEDFHSFAEFMTRMYYNLKDSGLDKLHRIDFGGGLPIDYTSSHAPNLMDLYARALIKGILEEKSRHGTKRTPPDIMIESGRGLTALSTMVVIKALEVRSVFPIDSDLPEDLMKEKEEWASKMARAESFTELVEIWSEFKATHSPTPVSLIDLHEREQMIGELRAEMRRELARVERTNLRSDRLIESVWHPDHIVIGNFSVFNSAGDHVLVKQHFPILPTRDLHVRPETTIRLVDITCDSDGEISQFHRKGVGEVWFTRDYRPLAMPNSEMGTGIPVGYVKNIQGSYFVIALTGAYQDVIEMNHNLLGDLPDVELVLTPDREWKVTWVSGAEAMDGILEEMGYFGIELDEDPYMSEN
jgi:arginine decarboxylase